MIKENLYTVNANIKRVAERANRKPGDIRLICVTKEADSSQVLDAISNGVAELGENRVREAVLKHKAIGEKVVWHLIGHLQTNKARDAVKIFSLIHSVDSVRLAQYIDKEAEKIGKIQEVLIEVNVSGEATKFGILPDKLASFIGSLKHLAHFKVKGLMTVTPFSENPENSRPYFKVLKKLCDVHGLKELSMGMTQDYEVAIEEGATMVRVGRAIFGEG
ncbi:MAG: YggS family pyridoxal phosphate-dependent enzyme [Candidatus Omnitrophica bacterium]|nr:YggS family pyridoxal phosphate-dependent enzyme [Candidatus Omnitrophota bacterium]